MAICSPTHRDLHWLLRGVLPTYDYNIVIRQGRPIPTPRNLLFFLDRGNRWSTSLMPSQNDQKMDQLEANIQEEMVDVFPSKGMSLRLKDTLRKKGNLPWYLWSTFIQTLWKHTALNSETPEYRNLLIPHLLRNLLPDIKRQIQTGVIGYERKSPSVFFLLLLLSIIIEAAF